MRAALQKTARRHLKKGRLNEAVEVLFQLFVATKGQLCAEEAWLLFDVCSQKISQTLQFHNRLSLAVRDVDADSNCYIMNNLWSSVVEDLRAECSEMFDLVGKVRVEVAEPVRESCLVEKVKHLLASKVCALWLEVTPVDHEEVSSELPGLGAKCSAVRTLVYIAGLWHIR